jgi:hypothetical protein
MANSENIRIEIGFDGGQVMSAQVSPEAADQLQEQLAAGGDGAFALDADDGRYIVALRRIVYVKRFARESRLGFGNG